MKPCTKFQGKRARRSGTGAWEPWQPMIFPYFASCSPLKFSWQSSFNLAIGARTLFIGVKRKIHYPFKWIQLIERSNYLNMNNRLHLSNKLKECSKFLWIRLWNLCFISMKESIFSKVAGCKPVTPLNWTPS